MKKIFVIVAAFAAMVSARAQHDPVVIEVAGQQIRQSELMREFLPTVERGLDTMSRAQKRQALQDYATLLADFRAKLADARALGFDNDPSLLNELAGYRQELAAPYLIDSTALDSLMRESYERNRFYLHAAHILVPCSYVDVPDDTLRAYRHALDLRARILGGEDFFAVSREEVARQRKDNPQAPKPGDNEGDLGYFTAFNMVYPFECGAYALQPGELSMPVRSEYGYHIIKLIDRLEWYGNVQFAHIWFTEGHRQSEVDSVYARLLRGADFGEMAAQFSDENSTSAQGGVMPELPLNRVLPDYAALLHHLGVGQVAEPIRTRYGWHIVKLLKREEMPPLSTLASSYRQRMMRDQRREMPRRNFIAQAKRRFGFVDYTVTPQPSRKKAKPVMMASLDELIASANDSLLNRKWTVDTAAYTDLRPLVALDGRTYNVRDVAAYVMGHQRRGGKHDLREYMLGQYNAFVDSVVLACANAHLEETEPEFAAVVEDYRRGLMIFNYNDQMIWQKAARDTAGYMAYYARESATKRLDNPADSIFFWKERARVVCFTVADSSLLSPDQALKWVKKGMKKGLTSGEIRDNLRARLSSKSNSLLDVTSSVMQLERAGQNIVADADWRPGTYVYPYKHGYRVAVVQHIDPPVLKRANEARGYYLNGYQNEVERQLLDTLETRYQVKIDRNAIDRISY